MAMSRVSSILRALDSHSEMEDQGSDLHPAVYRKSGSFGRGT